MKTERAPHFGDNLNTLREHARNESADLVYLQPLSDSARDDTFPS
jgi:hypothetical protein